MFNWFLCVSKTSCWMQDSESWRKRPVWNWALMRSPLSCSACGRCVFIAQCFLWDLVPKSRGATDCMLNLTDRGRLFANRICVTWNSQALHTSVVHLRLLIIDTKLLAQDVNLIKLIQKVYFNFHETNIYQTITE